MSLAGTESANYHLPNKCVNHYMSEFVLKPMSTEHRARGLAQRMSGPQVTLMILIAWSHQPSCSPLREAADTVLPVQPL